MRLVGKVLSSNRDTMDFGRAEAKSVITGLNLLDNQNFKSNQCENIKTVSSSTIFILCI